MPQSTTLDIEGKHTQTSTHTGLFPLLILTVFDSDTLPYVHCIHKLLVIGVLLWTSACGTLLQQ